MKTYAKVGVNRKLRDRTKKSLKSFELTYRLSRYGRIIKTPFNSLYPIGDNKPPHQNFGGGGKYQVKTCDGVGTKVFLAEMAGKHDTIGQDAVAMVVNDCIRCGARPIAITDMIDIKKSEPRILKEIQKGLIKGAKEANCPLIGGEIADVPELLNTTYHINCDCVGEIEKQNIITGEKIKPGDIIIGFRSSGIHSNGLTLARKVLLKKWGGKFNAFDKPNGLKAPLIYECLKPTKIYVKPFLKVAERFKILGAVHITGDAYLKFKKLIYPVRKRVSSNRARNFGFEFFNFKPQPIFNLIQRTGRISLKEMFRVFNMGWGFAIIVKKEDTDNILDLLKKEKVESNVIGKVTKKKEIVINYQNKNLTL